MANVQLHISLLSPLEVAQVNLFLFIARYTAIFTALSRSAPSSSKVHNEKTQRFKLTLAMMQMSRAPQRAVRLKSPPMLATIFTIFSTTSSIATQSQRIADVAAFQVGADFSGIPTETLKNDPHDYLL